MNINPLPTPPNPTPPKKNTNNQGPTSFDLYQALPNTPNHITQTTPKQQGLRIALTGRDEAGLEPLMAFLARYVTHPDFADTLSDAAHMVLGA